MRPSIYSSDDIIQSFYRNKVLTKKQLQDLWGGSTMTGWRILRHHGYMVSYNFRGKYYTLNDIAEFDDHGTWSYRNIRFSRYGTLYNTIRALVASSASGLNTDELEKILGVNIRSALSRLYAQNRISREKFEGVFVYLAQQEVNRQQQRRRRHVEIRLTPKHDALPRSDLIIAVLIELIQRIELEPKQLARRLSRKGIKLSTAQIQTIFHHYNLDTKKKRP